MGYYAEPVGPLHAVWFWRTVVFLIGSFFVLDKTWIIDQETGKMRSPGQHMKKQQSAEKSNVLTVLISMEVPGSSCNRYACQYSSQWDSSILLHIYRPSSIMDPFPDCPIFFYSSPICLSPFISSRNAHLLCLIIYK